MIEFVLRRLLASVATVVGAMVLLFTVLRSIPGDPAIVMLGPRATDAMIASMRERMMLDEPILVQLGAFLGNVARGDLGTDVLNDRPILMMVAEVLPYTIVLAVGSLLLVSRLQL